MKGITIPRTRNALNYAKKVGIVQEAYELGARFIQSNPPIEKFTKAIQLARGERLPDSHSFTNVPNEIWDLIIDRLWKWDDINSLRMTCRKLSAVVAARNDIKPLKFVERHMWRYDMCRKEDAMRLFGLDRNDFDSMIPAKLEYSSFSANDTVYTTRQIASRLAHKHHGSFELYKKHMAAMVNECLRRAGVREIFVV
jgi:hypothetical protein